MSKLKPRTYQQAIFETAKKYNTLVILPTGLGKTLIALLAAEHRLELFPESKILFLAPTRPLVEQHYNYFKKNFEKKTEMHLITGRINAKKRKEIWKNAQIIFSTPQCIENDLKNNLISLEEVSLLIVDEAHRCLKNYSYTFIAQEYKKKKNSRIIGLTASPGSSKEKIEEICKHLGIEKVEIRTRYSEDVKPYLQKLSVEVIKLDFPKEFEEIKEKLKKLFEERVGELKNRQLLFEKPTKKNLLELQKKLQRMIATGNNHFNILRGASACAQIIKIQHALELLETQGIFPLNEYFQDLLEQAEKKQSKAIVQLVKKKEFQDAYLKVIELTKKKINHPKLDKLVEIVEENKTKKTLIFSQYRSTVSKIVKMLEEREINARIFIGQARRKNSGLTQKEQKRILEDFRNGKINILVSTSIGEEGLDIPEVDQVIFYEPIPSAIRKIQRAGRTARLKPGKLIILLTKKTRDEAYYWAAYHKEKKMYGIIKNIKKKGLGAKKQKSILDFTFE